MKRVLCIFILVLCLGFSISACDSAKDNIEEMIQENDVQSNETNIEENDVQSNQTNIEENDEEEVAEAIDEKKLSTVKQLIKKAVDTPNYYFETWNTKVWHQGEQLKVETWDLINANTLSLEGERYLAGISLSDHANQKYNLYYNNKAKNKWEAIKVTPMLVSADFVNSFHSILDIRLLWIDEILNGWNGVDSEVERQHPNKNNVKTYLELKNIKINEGTIKQEKTNKSYEVYIVEVESFERYEKGSNTIYDMVETFYIDKNTGFPITYSISSSTNMHVLETYEYWNIQTGVTTDIVFDNLSFLDSVNDNEQPGSENLVLQQSSNITAQTEISTNADFGIIPDDVNEENLNTFLKSLNKKPEYYLHAKSKVDMGDRIIDYEMEQWVDGDYSFEEVTQAKTGDKTVIIMDDTFTYVFNPDTMEGHRTPNELEGVDEDYEEWEDEYSVVKKEILDGKPVIYVEFKEDEDEEVSLTKSWIYVNDGYPIILKSETYYNGKLSSSSNLVEYKKQKINKDKFTPPEGIQFFTFDNSGI